jgi:hypothetical protein
MVGGLFSGSNFALKWSTSGCGKVACQLLGWLNLAALVHVR